LIGTSIAVLTPADPLALVLWAFALSGSALFPVLVLSIWWKRLNALGAIAGMAVGFAVAIMMILTGEGARLGVPSALAGVFGIPAALAATLVATWLGPAAGRNVLARVREMRVPGGETVHDREMRLLRQKQRQRG
jgi:cation/acetate symporter